MNKLYKEGYVIEINDTINNKVLYYHHTGYLGLYETYHTTDTPLEAEVFKTKKEALEAKNSMYRRYPKKDTGYCYKIRFIRINMYYEFPKY